MPPAPEAAAGFATTRWSLVRAANQAPVASARGALEELCRTYWYPLYAYARRRGHEPADSEDLTQGFFAQLLHRDDLAKADPARGRFRTFLLTAFQHYLINEHARAHARKRGGDQVAWQLEMTQAEVRYGSEPSDQRTPERIFERRWALDLLERVRRLVRDEYAATGKQLLFERLEGTLTGGAADAPLARIALELGMSDSAVRVASHRLRRRYGERLREEIAQTLDDPTAVDDEIRELFVALHD